MSFCLLQKTTEKFKQALRSWKVDIEKLSTVSSKDRREFFKSILWSDEEAKLMNAWFEKTLLMKNQKAWLVSWAKQAMWLKPDVRRDLLARIDKMEWALKEEDAGKFLEDLLESKLRLWVNQEEASNILKMSKSIKDAELKITPDMPNGSKERLEYWLNQAMFREYVEKLKLQQSTTSLKQYIDNPVKAVLDVAGMSKSFLSTLDNSFFGRQGIKALFTNPTIWWKNFIKSWWDIGRSLAGKDAMLPIKAEIWSRQNAVNWLYKKSKLDVGLLSEEAFPDSTLSKIPLLWRVFKGAESAFNGAALRMRADIADKYFEAFIKHWGDVKDKVEIEWIWRLVNSLTGRASLWKAEAFGKELNVVFFSAKYVTSNFKTLFGWLNNLRRWAFKWKDMTFAEKQSAKNVTKIITWVASVLTLAEMLNPWSVEKDPRSTKFGKLPVKMADWTIAYVDISGWLTSVASLGARLVPTMNEWKWWLWTKDKSWNVISLNNWEYGKRTALDVAQDFVTGKFSPPAWLIRDLLKGKDFNWDKVTFWSALKSSALPIGVQQIIRKKTQDNYWEQLFYFSTLLETLGLNVSLYEDESSDKEPKRAWSRTKSKSRSWETKRAWAR